MAKVQFEIPDEEHDRFVRQARTEGMSLGTWLLAAAYQRIERQQRSAPFESSADLEAFFRACDALEDRGREPDWDQQLAVIDESRRRGSSST